MNKRIVFLVGITALLIGGVLVIKTWNLGAEFFWQISNQGQWLLPLVAISALLDSINPCAFSILLLTIAFLFSLGVARSRMFQIGGIYIAGIFFAYLFIGLGILQALHLFNTPHFMGKVGAFLLIGFGALNLLNVFIPQFPLKLQIPQAAHKWMAFLMEKASIPTAFLLGALVGLCEFPCTGGPYLMVLGFLHDQATYLKGLAYLIFYNLIFVVPLVLILFIASDRHLLEKVQAWRKSNTKGMRLWVGAAMILLGVAIFLL